MKKDLHNCIHELVDARKLDKNALVSNFDKTREQLYHHLDILTEIVNTLDETNIICVMEPAPEECERSVIHIQSHLVNAAEEKYKYKMMDPYQYLHNLYMVVKLTVELIEIEEKKIEEDKNKNIDPYLKGIMER